MLQNSGKELIYIKPIAQLVLIGAAIVSVDIFHES